MPRTLIEVITDDFTGDEHKPSEVEDVVLKFGYEEWKLVLTPDSKRKIRELLDPFVKLAPCKDSTPAWTKVPAAQADQSTGSGSAQTAAVIVPPDTPTVRRWWRDLKPAQLRELDLPEAKSSGRIPEEVTAAFVRATAVKPAGAAPAGAAAPAFSG